MSLVQEQFAAIARASLESQLAWFNAVTASSMQSVEKLATLNLTAARASVEEFSQLMHQCLNAKSPQELSSLLASQAGPSLEKAMSYHSHVGNIASNAQAEFSRVAEQQLSNAGRQASQLIGDAGNRLPISSEGMMSFIRARFGNAGKDAGSDAPRGSGTAAAEPVSTIIAASATPLVRDDQDKDAASAS